MVDSKELRIGNWVYYKLAYENTPIQVSLVSKGGVNYEGMTTKLGLDYRYIYPVPLTTDILEKCKGQLNKFYGVFDVVQLNSNHNLCGLYVDDQWTGVTVTYLHQLQNIYHSLTGKELEVTL